VGHAQLPPAAAKSITGNDTSSRQLAAIEASQPSTHPVAQYLRDPGCGEIADLGELGQENLQNTLLPKNNNYLNERVQYPWRLVISATDYWPVWEELGPQEAI
jgi:hypothetical protein